MSGDDALMAVAKQVAEEAAHPAAGPADGHAPGAPAALLVVSLYSCGCVNVWRSNDPDYPHLELLTRQVCNAVRAITHTTEQGNPT